MEKEYTYSAFISYSSKDEKVAKERADSLKEEVEEIIKRSSQ